jgi:hypothetical protein
MRFCNKQCEKEAHTKEKSTKKEPENPSGETEDLLKKEVEAEMKREEKIKRRIVKSWGKMSIGKGLSSGIPNKTLHERYLNEV